MVAASYPFLDVMWTLLVFFAWMLFFWMVIVLFTDLFGRDDLSGWAKAAWAIGIFIVPFLGALIYIITRPTMAEQEWRGLGHARRAAGTASPSPADELAKLNDLRAQGAITDAEFETLKQRTIST